MEYRPLLVSQSNYADRASFPPHIVYHHFGVADRTRTNNPWQIVPIYFVVVVVAATTNTTIPPPPPKYLHLSVHTHTRWHAQTYLFSVVDADAGAPLLGGANALLDGVREIRPASADITATKQYQMWGRGAGGGGPGKY